MPPEIEALRKTTIFARLPDASLHKLAARLRTRRFDSGASVFHQGDPGNALLVLVNGEIKITVPSPTGEDIILSVLRPGDAFGELALLDGLPRSAAAEATVESQILSLHRDDFDELLRTEPEIARSVLEALAGIIRRMNEKLADVAMLDVNGRMAKALLELADVHGHESPDGIIFDRVVSVEELAALTGLYRTEVARQISTYQYDDMMRVYQNPMIDMDQSLFILRHIDKWRRWARKG
jgi:CRP/FNR family cyclic AMP-dependent transcriptional regulator